MPSHDRTPKGVYHLQRKLLRALVPDATSVEVLEAIRCGLNATDESALPAYLASEGIGSLLHEQIARQCEPGSVPERLTVELRSVRWADAGMYLAQKAALREVDSLLEAAGIEYAVFKGAHVRELIYRDPSVRPSQDVDILVALPQRENAIEALVRGGFELWIDRTSDEASLVKGTVALDLHWEILRPGRSRAPTCEQLLKRRRRMEGFWGLSDTDAVFVMLVHPAFRDHVSNRALCSAVDFDRWLRMRAVDWNLVHRILSETGLKTAAWAVLTWFALLLPPNSPFPPEEFLRRIEPGQPRRAWISYWLRRNLPSRLRHLPLLPQLAFTLFLQDRSWDGLRFLARRMRVSLK